jgi:hypothetical protein
VNVRYHIPSFRARHNHLHLDVGLRLAAFPFHVGQSTLMSEKLLYLPFAYWIEKFVPFGCGRDHERATSSHTGALGLGTASDGCCTRARA